MFDRIDIQKKSRTLVKFDEAKAFFERFKVKKKRGDVEHISFCLFHKPCLFVTDDTDMLGEQFVKGILELRQISIMTSPQFVQEFARE